MYCFFFFKQKTAYEMRISDWSSDVCSSDLLAVSILVFFLLEVNGEAVAIKVLGPYTSPEQRALWLEANGYLQPWYIRYFTWLGDVVTGDFGDRKSVV